MKLTFAIGVNIIGLPVFHTMIIPDEQKVKIPTKQNVVLKRRTKGYQGPKGNTKNK